MNLHTHHADNVYDTGMLVKFCMYINNLTKQINKVLLKQHPGVRICCFHL